MAGDGRGPSKLTPQIHEKIIQMLRAGNYLETAAAVAGVVPNTLRNWMREGERGDPLYAPFAQDVEAALAEGEALLIQSIAKAGRGYKDPAGKHVPGDWRAAAWMLERRHAGRWAGKVRIEIEKQTEELFDIAFRTLPRKEYESLVEAIASAAEGGGAPERPDPSTVH